jgi:hypothetical protein
VVGYNYLALICLLASNFRKTLFTPNTLALTDTFAARNAEASPQTTINLVAEVVLVTGWGALNPSAQFFSLAGKL